LLPAEYNKTGNLDIVDKIKLLGLLPDENKKTGDLDTVDRINYLACYLTITRKYSTLT